jgi:hypothetical protein
MTAEREPWQAEAEKACLKSGAVKETADLVRIDPISGPGACGADRSRSRRSARSSLGYADDLRPPGSIGNQRAGRLHSSLRPIGRLTRRRSRHLIHRNSSRIRVRSRAIQRRQARRCA